MNVTVVIPAHNAAPYLDETLASIEKQSLAPREIIVVNDGSTDSTGLVAERRGTTVITSPGLGAAGALNLGIAQAKTELIAHFDADDLMLPEKLRQQVACFESDDTDRLGLVSSDLQMFGSTGLDESSFLTKRLRNNRVRELFGRSLRDEVVPSTDDDSAGLHDQVRRWGSYDSAQLLCLAHALDVKGVYRRTAWQEVGGFDATFRCAYDMDFVWRVSRHFDVAVIPTVLFHGRRHEGNLSGNSHLVALECARLFEDMARHRDGRDHLDRLRVRKRTELLDVAYIHRKRKRWIMSASYYWKAAWA